MPPEETVYHDPALRPGVVEAVDPSERALLARLGSSDEAIQVDGLTVEAPYAAASARRCRRITGAQTRVACETDGGWVFVPDVLADDPGGEP